MRTGACTVQQALTAEAASVLKHSLSLARRRGHAQVTPLHVAATLLSSTTSSSNLLRRACLKSQPHHPASHPLQCRALELCFNVALNRLPTTPPPCSGSLIHPHPSLSNALIAALKRAQAHQRRGCIEQQQQQFQQQQQQPLLALKVELEQLIVSILDDPSVSRVMREAGFSSTCVKNNIEEDNSSVSPPSSSFFFDSHREIISQGSLWQTHFLKSPSEPNSSQKEDLRVVLEVMLRKQGRRTNTVVVGDSPFSTERLVAELKGRVERGEVPDELKSAHFISLQLSYVHLRLMSRGDVDMKVSDLRAKICSLASGRGGVGVIIHAGDLRWAVDEEARDGGASVGGSSFKPVDHMVAEIARLISELSSSNSNVGGTVSSRVWLLATASYQTYRRCQMRQPSLETQWSLQAVVVPSGGLALSLQAPSVLDSRATKLAQYPFQMLESKTFGHRDDEDKLNCCVECTCNYEKEASILKSDIKDNYHGPSHLPSWLQPYKSDNQHKDTLLELRRKWNRLCQTLHHARRNQIHMYPPLFNQSLMGKNHLFASSHPWWSTSLQYKQNKFSMGPRSISFGDSPPKRNAESTDYAAQMKNTCGKLHEGEVPMKWLSEVSLHSLNRSPNHEVRTTLALGSSLFSNLAKSKDQHEGFVLSLRELSQRLQENIPWQSEAIPSIMEALQDCRPSEKGTCLLIQGTDRIGKRRLARVAAESLCGSVDRLVHINMIKFTSRTSSFVETIAEALRKDPKCVVLIEDIDRVHTDLVRTLVEGLQNGFFEDQSGKELSLAHGMFIITTSSTSIEVADTGENAKNVVKMRLWVEEISPENSNIGDHKRKPEWNSSSKESKKPRMRVNELDLNICAEDDHGNGEVEDALPSNLSQEIDSGDLHLPHGLIDSISARFTLDAGPDMSCRMSDSFISKLNQAFEEARGGGEGNSCLCIDQAVVEELMAASGSFLESLFERWLREVFQTSLPMVRKGGKVRLGVEGKEGNLTECGYMGSVLPNRVHVDSISHFPM